jgi:hypothetical protein
MPERPADNAPKAVWLAYVEARTDITNTGGTRDALRARVDEADAAAALESDPHAEIVGADDTAALDAHPVADVDEGQAADTTPVELHDDQVEDGSDRQESEQAAREEAANAMPTTPTVNPPVFANPAGTGGAQGDGTGPGMVNFATGGPGGPFEDPDRRDVNTPVHTMKIGSPVSPGGLGTRRAGGYVLTEHGWVIAEQAPAPDNVPLPTETVLVDREGARVGTLADGRTAVDGVVVPVAGLTPIGGAAAGRASVAGVEPVKPAGVPVEAHIVIDPVDVGVQPVAEQVDPDDEGTVD